MDFLKIKKSDMTISNLHRFYKDGSLVLHGEEKELCDMPFSFDQPVCGMALPNVHALVSIVEGSYHYDVFKGSSYLSSVFDFMDNDVKTASTLLPTTEALVYQDLPHFLSRRFCEAKIKLCSYDVHNSDKDSLRLVISMLSPHCLSSLSI